jgi:hypothetical protein
LVHGPGADGGGAAEEVDAARADEVLEVFRLGNGHEESLVWIAV